MKIILRLPLTLLLLTLFLPVLTSAQSENKAVYGVLIDNTGSLRPQFGNIQILGKAIVKNVNERGIISLFNFETQGDSKKPFAVVTSGTEWSQDKNALEKYIYGLQSVGGQTTLLDAIRSIGKTIGAKANAEKLSEKIIVLITDGEDRTSEVKEKQLIKELKESGVKVYAIGLVQELDAERGFTQESSRRKATNFLKKVTKETGGNAIFPKLEETTKAEDLLTELFAKPIKK
jgi:phosphopentomutase